MHGKETDGSCGLLFFRGVITRHMKKRFAGKKYFRYNRLFGIGAPATILAGVTIGDTTVIGAG